MSVDLPARYGRGGRPPRPDRVDGASSTAMDAAEGDGNVLHFTSGVRCSVMFELLIICAGAVDGVEPDGGDETTPTTMRWKGVIDSQKDPCPTAGLHDERADHRARWCRRRRPARSRR